MGEAKVWKMGDKWAGISARGKRVVKKSKSAAQTAVGITGKSKSKKVKKTTEKTKRRYKMTIPIAPTIGLAVGLIAPAQLLFAGKMTAAVEKLAHSYLGIRFATRAPKFDMSGLAQGVLPLVIGLLVHKFVGGSLGLNRMLGRAKVPLLRL